MTLRGLSILNWNKARDYVLPSERSTSVWLIFSNTLVLFSKQSLSFVCVAGWDPWRPAGAGSGAWGGLCVLSGELQVPADSVPAFLALSAWEKIHDCRLWRLVDIERKVHDIIMYDVDCSFTVRQMILYQRPVSCQVCSWDFESTFQKKWMNKCNLQKKMIILKYNCQKNHRRHTI